MSNIVIMPTTLSPLTMGNLLMSKLIMVFMAFKTFSFSLTVTTFLVANSATGLSKRVTIAYISSFKCIN